MLLTTSGRTDFFRPVGWQYGPLSVGEIAGAPHGHNIYVGPLVNNPSVESGALINLLGVDSSGSISDQGWRFVDPDLPLDVTRNSLYILWLTHDQSGPLSNGDLQIGFNRVFVGRHYANPMHTTDRNLGSAANKWVTIYSDNLLVLLFKAAARAAGSGIEGGGCFPWPASARTSCANSLNVQYDSLRI